MSRSASSSALWTSSKRIAVTTASLLPSSACLVSDRVMSPIVPACNPSEIAPVLLSHLPVQSSSSHISCSESLPSLAAVSEAANSDNVCSVQLPNKQHVDTAMGSCDRLNESQVQCLQSYVMNYVN